jgi:hypothetical protein
MKIRNGFVSNSSSSSFVVVIPKEDYEKMMNEVDGFQKAVIEALGPKKDNVFGREAMIISGFHGNISSFEYMEPDFKDYYDLDEEEFEDKYGYEPYPSEAWYNVTLPDSAFQHNVDC